MTINNLDSKLIDIMNKRHNIRFFDEKKIPSKEQIDQILKDSHNTIPHKNNLIQIEINVWDLNIKKKKKH